MAKFTVGQQVVLRPFEDQPLEKGVILAVQKKAGMLIVQLDEPSEQDDDGLREVTFSQILS